MKGVLMWGKKDYMVSRFIEFLRVGEEMGDYEEWMKKGEKIEEIEWLEGGRNEGIEEGGFLC